MEAEQFAAEVLTVLKQPLVAEGFEIEMDVSLGLAVFHEDGLEAAALWRDADTAMYRAKHAGGAQGVRVSNEISASAIEAPDKGDAPHQIAMLARLGLQFSVDDFGTGYSSLGRLHQLPVQSLKIDRSFIERITEAKGTYPIVQAMIELATTSA